MSGERSGERSEERSEATSSRLLVMLEGDMILLISCRLINPYLSNHRGLGQHNPKYKSPEYLRPVHSPCDERSEAKRSEAKRIAEKGLVYLCVVA